ncbi:serine hydrolase domain-containing protein [Spongiivirga sp. MCCC 1A20706]|uniref:serine hydrolase domain-containing protein n=1 Tax=Spongiivirga sp. MCCC 1A20706 TaxID=3160963 RepID=UPI00397779D5
MLNKIKKTKAILILLMMSFSLTSFSCTNSKSKTFALNTENILKQYVGEYIYEAVGISIMIYTKEEENNRKLYLFVSGDQESELMITGEHKFAFRAEPEFKVEFRNKKNGIFNELVLIQPQGNVTAVRKEKATIKIDDLATIDDKLTERDFRGVVLVAQNDSIIFNKAYGKKNNQENGLNDLNTVFDICSITKQFTAAGILKLSTQNKLTVTDKLSKYFDDVPKDKKDITIHQLLTHSSGLAIGIGDDYDTITEEKFLRRVFRSRLISTVGKEFNYSNIGYSLLALIIEKVSGMEYESFLNEYIFKPSKMYHTGYVIPKWKKDDVANGFFEGQQAKKPNEENWSDKGPYLNLKGNGGILASANDMLLWSKAIRENTVFDEATTATYLYPHFEYSGGNETYGYGWWIENNDTENKLVRHSGGSDLFATDLWMYPQKGITIIVFSNTQDLTVLSITRKISNFLLQE